MSFLPDFLTAADDTGAFSCCLAALFLDLFPRPVLPAELFLTLCSEPTCDTAREIAQELELVVPVLESSELDFVTVVFSDLAVSQDRVCVTGLGPLSP